MNQFYLNNIVGSPASVADGKNALCNVAKAFGRLSAQEELNVDRRIVMDKEPGETCFGQYYLRQLIDSIEDEIEKRYAYVMLRAATPMEDYLPWDENAENLIAGDYRYEGEDATNLAVANSHDAIILSVAFSEAFRKNTLTLSSAAEESDNYPKDIIVNNLYGNDSNTEYIQCILQGRKGVSVELFDKIREIEDTYIHSSVEKEFAKLSSAQKQSIVDGFEEAIRQKLLFPKIDGNNLVINPNDELVRYEPYSKKEKIFELAIYHPLAIRVYLAQDNGILYILSISSKKASKDGNNQNAEIRAAEKRFRQMKKAL